LNTDRRNTKAFSLMELMLVLLILGMLATVGVMSYGPIRDRARKQTAEVKLKEIRTALEAFEMALSRYPSEQEGLEALCGQLQSDDEKESEKWSAVFQEVPEDPWGEKYNYEPVETDSEEYKRGIRFKVWSNGPDKESGTDDDIKSWKEDTGGA